MHGKELKANAVVACGTWTCRRSAATWRS